MKAIFLCLNLKPGDEFFSLKLGMASQTFNCLSWVLASVAPRVLLGIPAHVSIVYLSETEDPPRWSRALSKWSMVFLQTSILKNWTQYLSTHTNSTVQIYLWVQRCKIQQPGYYDFSTLTFSNYMKHTYLEIFSGKDPGSMWDSITTEKNLMRIAGMKKNMKWYQIKVLLSRVFVVPKMFYKQVISEKESGFQKLKQLLILILLQQTLMLKDSLGMFVY